MVHYEADEGFAWVLTADEGFCGWGGDEVDYDVEGWKAKAGVDGCDVGGEELLGGGGSEG